MSIEHRQHGQRWTPKSGRASASYLLMESVAGPWPNPEVKGVLVYPDGKRRPTRLSMATLKRSYWLVPNDASDPAKAAS